MLAIAVAILVQVVGRLRGVNLFGLVEISTYAMVAATFLALPYTLRTGGHIRIPLLLNRFPGRARRGVEVACYGVALAFVLYFFLYAASLTLDSFQRGARSQGMLSAPLWIPQSLMSAGIGLFAVALLHGLVRVLRGERDWATDEEESPL